MAPEGGACGGVRGHGVPAVPTVTNSGAFQALAVAPFGRDGGVRGHGVPAVPSVTNSDAFQALAVAPFGRDELSFGGDT